MIFDDYTIRLLTIQDVDAYFQLVEKNRKCLEDFFSGTVTKTKIFEDIRIFITEIEQRVKDRTYFPYIIIDNSNSKIAGFLDLKNID